MVTNFKKKKQVNPVKTLWITIGGVALAVIAIVLIIANIRLYHTRQELNSQIKTLQNKVGEIKQQNDRLSQGIQNANDSQYIEKVAREELDLQKPGEKVVSFINPPAVPQQGDVNSKNVLESWLAWVGGIFKK